MFLRRFSINFIPRHFHLAPSIRNFSSQQPDQSQKDEKKEEEPIIITPKKVIYGLMALSWVYIFKIYFDAKDRTRERAEAYYDAGGKLDEPIEEEYRKEYVK